MGMMQGNIDFQDMESFVMLCRLGSFTRAAQYLYISQSALSRRIKTLEEQMGVELVKRGGASIEVTREGRWFYQSCLKLLKEKEELCCSMQRIRLGEEGVLRISYDPGAIFWPRILKAVTQMKRDDPGIRVQLYRNDFLETEKDLLENRVDAALTEVSLWEDHPAFSSVPVGEDHLMACLFRTHPLIQKSFLTLEELRGEELAFAFSAQDLYLIRLAGEEKHLGLFLSFRRLLSVEEGLFRVAGCGAITLLRERDAARYASLSSEFRFVPIVKGDQDLQKPVPITLTRAVLLYRSGNSDHRLKTFLAALSDARKE